jgi:hypothetical protein
MAPVIGARVFEGNRVLLLVRQWNRMSEQLKQMSATSGPLWSMCKGGG